MSAHVMRPSFIPAPAPVIEEPVAEKKEAPKIEEEVTVATPTLEEMKAEAKKEEEPKVEAKKEEPKVEEKKREL